MRNERQQRLQHQIAAINKWFAAQIRTAEAAGNAQMAARLRDDRKEMIAETREAFEKQESDLLGLKARFRKQGYRFSEWLQASPVVGQGADEAAGHLVGEAASGAVQGAITGATGGLGAPIGFVAGRATEEVVAKVVSQAVEKLLNAIRRQDWRRRQLPTIRAIDRLPQEFKRLRSPAELEAFRTRVKKLLQRVSIAVKIYQKQIRKLDQAVEEVRRKCGKYNPFRTLARAGLKQIPFIQVFSSQARNWIDFHITPKGHKKALKEKLDELDELTMDYCHKDLHLQLARAKLRQLADAIQSSVVYGD